MTDALRMGDVVQLREDKQASVVGILAGYFARYNEPTVINNPVEGHFIEKIAPGAFTKTLQDRGRSVPVLFHHGLDPAIGMRPLGVPSVIDANRAEGVYAEVPLDDTSYNRDLAASLRSGSLGQSFRFAPVTARDTWTRSGDLPEVTRGEVILREFGPTPIPAYSGSTAGLRSGDLPDLRIPTALSLVRFLCDPDNDPAFDALFPELRAGQVLSNENLALIDQARTHLTKVIDNHAAKKRDADTPEDVARDGESPASTLDLPLLALSRLRLLSKSI